MSLSKPITLDMRAPETTQTASDSTDDMSLASRFVLQRQLGDGGMGRVFEAYDQVRGERVALKRLTTINPQSIHGFKREFRAVASIAHPNVVSLRELFADEEGWFFTMELIDGVDIVQHCRPQPVRSSWDQDATATHIPSGDTPVSPIASHILGHQDDERALAQEDTAALVEHVPVYKTEAFITTCAPQPISETTVATRPIAQPQPVDHQAAAALLEKGLPQVPAIRTRLHDDVDIDRLRKTLIQLVQAIHALHTQGVVHRDIKPSNVLVTPEQRVVLLDFGIVVEKDARARMRSTEGMLVGTPSFMAPEQTDGRQATEASDWYSLGVILYMTLTGNLPYTGTAYTVCRSKRLHDPLPPSRFTRDIPEDLERLCLQLLRRDSRHRPDVTQILSCLGVESPRVDTTRTNAKLFIGRNAELAMLRSQLAFTRDGDTRWMFIGGQRGVGKTTLCERFLRDVERDSSNSTWVLSGRATPREQVPYNALDSIVEQLVTHLQMLPQHEIAQCLPQRIDALVTRFPAFRRLDSCRSLAVTSGDSDEICGHAHAALFEVIRAMCAIKPMLVFIDDAQHADGDSRKLLDALVATANVGALLIVVSYTQRHPNSVSMNSADEWLDNRVLHASPPDAHPTDESSVAFTLTREFHRRVSGQRMSGKRASSQAQRLACFLASACLY